MATVIPKYNRIVQDQPQQAFYMVSIDTSSFLDTTSNNAGRISPCVAEDFATAPTTLAQSRLISRGALRFKKMLEILQVRSNVSVRNILTTYGSDAGDQAITKLQFGLVLTTTISYLLQVPRLMTQLQRQQRLVSSKTRFLKHFTVHSQRECRCSIQHRVQA